MSLFKRFMGVAISLLTNLNVCIMFAKLLCILIVNLNHKGINMKKTSLILMLILASQVSAGPREKKTNDLNLTEQQRTQMQAVKQQQHEKLMAAREAIMAESMAAMASFLTAEQMAQVEQKHEHRKAHGELKRDHRKMKRKGRRQNQETE